MNRRNGNLLLHQGSDQDHPGAGVRVSGGRRAVRSIALAVEDPGAIGTSTSSPSRRADAVTAGELPEKFNGPLMLLGGEGPLDDAVEGVADIEIAGRVRAGRRGALPARRRAGGVQREAGGLGRGSGVIPLEADASSRRLHSVVVNVHLCHLRLFIYISTTTARRSRGAREECAEGGRRERAGRGGSSSRLLSTVQQKRMRRAPTVYSSQHGYASQLGRHRQPVPTLERVLRTSAIVAHGTTFNSALTLSGTSCSTSLRFREGTSTARSRSDAPR